MAMKMNLLDMQKLGLLNGEISEEDVQIYNRNTVILTFAKCNEILCSEYQGKRVLPALNDLQISEGTWICDVVPQCGEYRAKAVRKLDASFFLELKQSQKQFIIDTIWNNNKEEILHFFEEKYKEDYENKLNAAVDSALTPYKEEIDLLKEENDRLTQDLERSRILLENKTKVEIVSTDNQKIELSSEAKARRVSADMIKCELFTRSRYFVHISMDKKTMFVQPHDYGKVICLDNTLFLSNLGTIVPYIGECNLRIESRPEKGFYIYFD